MKLSLFFVAILGVSAVAAVPAGKTVARSTRDLSDDWADFYALIDTDAILEIVIQYLAVDEQVQSAVQYLFSEEFKSLVVTIDNLTEYIDFLNYLHDCGLNVYYYVNLLHSILGLEELKVPTQSISVSRLVSTRITGGIAGLWADIKAVLPLVELRELYDYKLANSEQFAQLIEHLKSPKARTVYNALKENPEYQHIRGRLIDCGLDIEYFFNWLRDLIGYE